MWTTVYVATGHNRALMIEEKLRAEGFLVKVRNFGVNNEHILYEILVLEFEAKDAQDALIELGIL